MFLLLGLLLYFFKHLIMFLHLFPREGFQSAHCSETWPALTAVCKPWRVSPGYVTHRLLRIHSLWYQINFQEGFELDSSITGGLGHCVINQGKRIYFNNQIHHITLVIFFLLVLLQTPISHPQQSSVNMQREASDCSC